LKKIKNNKFFCNSGKRAGNRGGGVYEEKAGGQPQGGDEATN